MKTELEERTERMSCVDFFMVYDLRQERAGIEHLSHQWEREENIRALDFYRNPENPVGGEMQFINTRAFLAEDDLYGKTKVFEAERFLVLWKTKGKCHYAESNTYKEALRLFDRDSYSQHIFDISKECQEKLKEKYDMVLGEEMRLYEKNCFDLKYGADNSWKKKVKMDGDIIITDPCYLIKQRDESKKPKWEDYHPYGSLEEYPDYKDGVSEMFEENNKLLKAEYAFWNLMHPDDRDSWNLADLYPFGFTRYIAHDTLAGDWHCKTYQWVHEIDDVRELGEFCADSGHTGIFLLDEVLTYNPAFAKKLRKCPHIATIIMDFHGEVWFEKKDKETLFLRGDGNIEFCTRQVWF